MPTSFAIRWRALCLVPLAVFTLAGCEVTPNEQPEQLDAAWTHECTLDGDEDSDGISNRDEGCMYGDSGTDTDGDSIPDYLDLDSDNDGIPDEIEHRGGSSGSPDADGDSVPNFRDLDSDSDGVPDAFEDRNGDGLVGSCVKACDPIASPPECGGGQQCTLSGACEPSVAFECSQGETDPYHPDTDGDGVPDFDEGTWVCHEESADNALGFPGIAVYRTDLLAVATPARAVWTAADIDSVGQEECSNGVDDDADGHVDCEDADCRVSTICGASVAFVDLPDEADSVASFIVTVPAIDGSDLSPAALIQAVVPSTFTPEEASAVTRGNPVLSHDDMPSVIGSTLAVSLPTPSNIWDLRNALALALLERGAEDLSQLTDGDTYPGSGSSEPYASGTDFWVRYSQQTRIIGSDEHWVFVGAVGLVDHHADSQKNTAALWSSLSDLTSIASSDATLESVCEVAVINDVPKADIIWVIDESGSMEDDRQNVAAHALQLFGLAVDLGLDFRMGIVDVSYHNDGVFCTRQAVSEDRFLLPNELLFFQECVEFPWGAGQWEGGQEYGMKQGFDAVMRHLPTADATNRIRPDAEVAVIYLSDEMDQEIHYACCPCQYNETITDVIVDGACVQQQITPSVSLFTGQSVSGFQATAHAIIWPRGQTCDSATEPGIAYHEIAEQTGGVVANLCQPDLSQALNTILTDIVANSSPVVLQSHPVSLTLAASLQGDVLARSTTDGFDYSAVYNSLLFYNQPHAAHPPGELIVGYQRWTYPGDP